MVNESLGWNWPERMKLCDTPPKRNDIQTYSTYKHGDTVKFTLRQSRSIV